MTSFHPFGKAVAKHFDGMSACEELYVVDSEDIFEKYLAAFPAGTNPIFRERTEHDCSCCKHFVRNVGNVVSISDYGLVTIWDVEGLEYPYNVVAREMAEYIRSLPIKSVFRTVEKRFGAEETRDFVTGKWNHFFCDIHRKFQTTTPDKDRGEINTNLGVFRRGLEELTADAIETVVDLIKSNSIYRGQEHFERVNNFKELRRRYPHNGSQTEKDIYLWSNVKNFASGFKNTVIGSLVEDLSKDVDLESAVGKFEAKVAPHNYKRSKALITPKMISDAVKTINELGLETALQRRFAKISDVKATNVLFVDNAVRGKMKDGITSILMDQVKTKAPDIKNATNIRVDEFMENVLPNSASIDILVKNSMMSNFMSLTAPVHDEVERLFKWDNNFAWSYDGNITDSGIKEKVKQAGGNVTNAKLRISLAWFNFDDLDIHVKEPSGNVIYYGNKGGKLDVDMNVSATRRDAVENVSWTSLQDGTYKVYINNFTKRESIDVGCVVEVENNGLIHNYNYAKPLGHSIPIIDVMVKNGLVTNIVPHKDVVGGHFEQEKWGVKTETLIPVDTIILSPNYWDGKSVGNKHWFFILKDCKNPDQVRGIYNEFLKSELDKHRKVFEILGDKTKCETSDDQLSGVGFSSTKPENLIAHVKSNDGRQKLYNIQF